MNILEMTHEELMNSSMEVKNAWSDAQYNELYERAKFLFEKGNKHIQLGWRGCIKIKKNEFGIYYTTRSGMGTGANLGEYADLRDCVKSLQECGWYERDALTYR
jgi:hypothetical protein